MSKKDFEEMMSLDGIKPLKKKGKKNRKQNKSKKTFAEMMAKEDIYEKEDVYEIDEDLSFAEMMNKESGIKESKKKRKENINFEEALNLYAPEDSSNINKNNGKKYKVIFRKNYSNISLDDILHKVDLHGLNIEEAKTKVKYELSFCKSERISNLLIVTGKGRHSKNGAVIKIAIEKMLLSLPKIIEMLEYAPIQAGGDGAFIVSLR